MKRMVVVDKSEMAGDDIQISDRAAPLAAEGKWVSNPTRAFACNHHHSVELDSLPPTQAALRNKAYSPLFVPLIAHGPFWDTPALDIQRNVRKLPHDEQLPDLAGAAAEPSA